MLSFGYFSLHKKRKVTGCRATPDDFDFKTQKTEAKIQNITLLLKFKKAPSIPLGDNPSETAGQKTLRDAPVVVKLRR